MSGIESYFLETPNEVPVKKLEKFLKKYKFNLNKDQEPISLSTREAWVYTIEGPQLKYKDLEKAVNKKGYKIWKE